MPLFKLDNGREYRIIYTGHPYIGGEYPKGGYKILTKLTSGIWSYIDNAPDIECVNNFLKAASKLDPIDSGQNTK